MRTVDSILLIEDRREDRILFEEILSETSFCKAEVSVSDTLEGAKREVLSKEFDIILIDLFISDSSGLGTFLTIKEACKGVPIIILTGMEDQEFAMASIEKGAQDYLLKSKLEPFILEKSIGYAMERQKINNHLNYLHGQMNSFVHSISHDIRGPIINLKSLMEMYKQLNEQQILDELEKTIGNLNNMINNFSEFLRLRDGKNQSVKVVLDELLKEVCASMESDISDVRAVIHSDFTQCPALFFNREMIRTILFNLISNAIKYRRPGVVPEVHISSFTQDKYTCIKVKDNGIGIDTSSHGKHIFDLSYRISHKKEGKGIGLYIIQTIAENHNGHVEVESNLGEGSSFSVYLSIGR